MSSYEPSADDVSSVDPGKIEWDRPLSKFWQSEILNGISFLLLEVTFSPRAYSKMILHAAKYPHCAINGLLLVFVTIKILFYFDKKNPNFFI